VQPADYFRKIPLFSDLGPEEIVDVLRIARVVTFAPGKLLCARGERGDCAFVIEHGEAAVRAIDEGGTPMVIARVGAGEVVGELSLVDGGPRSADVIAVTEVRGYRLDRSELDGLRKAMHPAAFKIMRRIAITVSDRLRDVNDGIAQALASKAAASAQAGKPAASARVSDPGRPSRAGMRASRELGRASLPEPAAAQKGTARATPRSTANARPSAAPARPARVSREPAPVRTSRASPQPAQAHAPAPAKEPSVWRTMLDRLSGGPWK